TAAVSDVASRAGINVISFSNNGAVAGGRVFVLGLTFENTANRLVKQAIANGQQRIAIVHQQGIEGEAGRTAVENAILNNGGQVATITNYPLNIAAMSEQTPAIAAELKTSGANAVFFTDSPLQGLGIITAALSSESYRSGREAQFLGLTRWDASTDVLQQPNLQGGWFAVPDPDLMSQFDARYLATYGAEPHNLSPIAYDAVAAVGAMVASAVAEGSAEPFSLARMTNAAGFAGSMGVFRFLPNGQNERALAIMQVNSGTATMISPAPRGFVTYGF
ncbi:MAG TPA: ABC transporter substrate-binding protein, partial [Paracoccaceae bacterium]|nr:ABC transporter substrate-binding protein [Paracoccaceae bacterium]